MKKIYISGPITGREKDECRLHFATVESNIRGRACANGLEFAFFNPTSLRLDHLEAPKWSDYMKACITELVKCDGIAVLAGWEQSRGARIEIKLADSLGIPVIYLESPVNELDIVCLESANAEIYRYWVLLCSRWAKLNSSDEMAHERSLVELTHRFLDPHGFEYID